MKVFVVGAVGLCLAACGAQDGEDGKRVGQVEQAVHGGDLDTGSMFPDVVYLFGDRNDSGEGWACSGTLISPRVVLTAVHCFENALGGVQATVRVRIGFAPFDPTTAVERTHTFANSGEILVRKDDLDVTPLDDNDVAREIAVVILDEAVPPSVALPRPRPTTANSCSPDFTGTVVGYGSSNFTVIDNENICGDDMGAVRRFISSSGWTRSDEGSHGSVYLNEWTFAAAVPCTYEGFAEGDSGGPLLDGKRSVSRVPDAASGSSYCGAGGACPPVGAERGSAAERRRGRP